MKLYKRTLRAGRLVKKAVYTRPIPTSDPKTRAKRRESTRSAQRFINSRNQSERLSLKIAGNFDNKDACFCTLTYNDNTIPTTKKEVKKHFEKIIKELRDCMKYNGHELKYIRSIEGVSTDDFPNALDPCGIDFEKRPWNDAKQWQEEGAIERSKHKEPKKVRYHIHLIINLTKSEYEVLRSLWVYGHVYIASIRVNDPETFPKLASYMTKDTRTGQTKNGERCYSCSKGLVNPVIVSEWIDTDDLIIPENAQCVIEDECIENRWAYCHRVGYIINERNTVQIDETKRRGKRPL